VAIAFAEGTRCSGTDVREDKVTGGFSCETREVHTVPGRCRAREDAWLRGERERRVVADSEAVAIVRAPEVEPEAAVIGLG